MKKVNILKNKFILLAIGWGFYLAGIFARCVGHSTVLSTSMYMLACFFFISVIIAFFIPSGD